jgi:hypothetical protein
VSRISSRLNPDQSDDGKTEPAEHRGGCQRREGDDPKLVLDSVVHSLSNLLGEKRPKRAVVPTGARRYPPRADITALWRGQRIR